MTETPGEGTPRKESEPGYWEQQARPPHQGYGYAPQGQQPGIPPYAPYGSSPPNHPESNTVLALGLVAILGGMFCYLPIFVAPFAWVIGNRVTREIEASGGRWGGRSEAQAGKILGIIGSVLLALGLLVIILVTVLIVAGAGLFDGSGNSNV